MFSNSFFAVAVDWFHNFNCSLLVFVLSFVLFFFFFLFKGFFFFKIDGAEYLIFEFFCGFLPVLVLLFQILPSLGVLYSYGVSAGFSDLCLKVLGRQWYWSYSYGDFYLMDFDSYLTSSDSLGWGAQRLLDVDNRCVLPLGLIIFFCVSSRDVVHSWSLFNMSIKVDAMRGVLRTFFYSFPVPGLYYGQCSEICGANHRFIPVVLEVSNFSGFKCWCFLF